MNDKREQKLDELLRARRVEPASVDLARRIILKARALPQAPSMSPWQSLRQIFAELHLPQPGYVLAGALLLGMAIGFSAPQQSALADETALRSFLAGDEAFL